MESGAEANDLVLDHSVIFPFYRTRPGFPVRATEVTSSFSLCLDEHHCDHVLCLTCNRIRQLPVPGAVSSDHPISQSQERTVAHACFPLCLPCGHNEPSRLFGQVGRPAWHLQQAAQKTVRLLHPDGVLIQS